MYFVPSSRERPVLVRLERILKPTAVGLGYDQSDRPVGGGREGGTGRWCREMPMDDPTLVESLRSGDPQAPRLLIERYQGVVFGLCYRMMNHQQDAEDVTQETFIRACGRWRGSTPRGRSALGC